MHVGSRRIYGFSDLADMNFVKEYNKKGKVKRTFRVDLPELGGKDAEKVPFCYLALMPGGAAIWPFRQK